MRSLGSFIFIIGALAIVLGFLDRVPKLLIWIYNWGEGPAWAIKIGLVVLGGILFLTGKKPEPQPQPEEPQKD